MCSWSQQRREEESHPWCEKVLEAKGTLMGYKWCLTWLTSSHEQAPDYKARASQIINHHHHQEGQMLHWEFLHSVFRSNIGIHIQRQDYFSPLFLNLTQSPGLWSAHWTRLAWACWNDLPLTWESLQLMFCSVSVSGPASGLRDPLHRDCPSRNTCAGLQGGVESDVTEEGTHA